MYTIGKGVQELRALYYTFRRRSIVENNQRSLLMLKNEWYLGSRPCNYLLLNIPLLPKSTYAITRASKVPQSTVLPSQSRLLTKALKSYVSASTSSTFRSIHQAQVQSSRSNWPDGGSGAFETSRSQSRQALLLGTALECHNRTRLTSVQSRSACSLPLSICPASPSVTVGSTGISEQEK